MAGGSLQSELRNDVENIEVVDIVDDMYVSEADLKIPTGFAYSIFPAPAI